jgi:uncharacterized protein (TIGR03435 family)
MRALICTLAILISSTAAQTFEVASIKPSPPYAGMVTAARGGPGSDDPTFFTCENYGLSGIIWLAFGLEDYQLSGPEWMLTTQFTVSAKIPPGTSRAQFRTMLQNLLIERFKMTFHREEKKMPLLSLVVAKNGPKFKESKPSGEDRTYSVTVSDKRGAMRSSEETMPALAQVLSNQLRQPVRDATGLTGKYDINISWFPTVSPDSPGPTIFQALQDQLGLKLESKKGMVEVLVIDHIENKPTEN